MADKHRQTPFGGFTDFFSEINRMRQIGRTGHDPHEGQVPHQYASAWVPAADIFARRGELVIRIELPGMEAGDVNISYAEGLLTISGERDTDLGAEDATFYVRERYRGAFRRSMTLPEGTPASAISAEFHAGLVEITISGYAPEGRERIDVQDRSAERTTRRLG